MAAATPAVQSTPDPGLAALAEQLLGAIDEFAAEIAAQIQQRVPFYGAGSDVSVAELRYSCRGNAEYVLRSFLTEQVPDVSAAQATGSRRAEQGVPLPTVTAAFRVGFRQIWAGLVAHARREGLVSADALVNAASDIWAAHDTFAEAMATAHREASMARVLRAERERSALVAALLEGRYMEETTLWEVADILRLPKRGPFIVVAAEPAKIAREALPGVETLLRRHDIGSAWRLHPDAHVGIVRLTDETRLGKLTDLLTGVAKTRAGISPPYTALTETAAALRFARIALASTPPHAPHVTQFDDFPLAVAAVSAPDVMNRVARTVLGGQPHRALVAPGHRAARPGHPW